MCDVEKKPKKKNQKTKKKLSVTDGSFGKKITKTLPLPPGGLPLPLPSGLYLYLLVVVLAHPPLFVSCLFLTRSLHVSSRSVLTATFASLSSRATAAEVGGGHPPTRDLFISYNKINCARCVNDEYVDSGGGRKERPRRTSSREATCMMQFF